MEGRRCEDRCGTGSMRAETRAPCELRIPASGSGCRPRRRASLGAAPLSTASSPPATLVGVAAPGFYRQRGCASVAGSTSAWHCGRPLVVDRRRVWRSSAGVERELGARMCPGRVQGRSLRLSGPALRFVGRQRARLGCPLRSSLVRNLPNMGAHGKESHTCAPTPEPRNERWCAIGALAGRVRAALRRSDLRTGCRRPPPSEEVPCYTPATQRATLAQA